MISIPLAPSLQQQLRQKTTESFVKDLARQKLINWTYSPEEASSQAKELTDEILSKLEQQSFSDRYKYTVQTWISNQRDGGLYLASRTVLDPTTDTAMTVTYETESFICIVGITVTFVY